MPAELDLTALVIQLRRQGRLVAQTVYECSECGERYLGERRCPDYADRRIMPNGLIPQIRTAALKSA